MNDTEQQLTPMDLIKFMEDHNCYETCCKGWTREDLIRALSLSMQNKTFAWFAENGVIKGVCIGEPKSMNLVFIHAIICISKVAMAHLLIHFKMNYPMAELQGYRNGELVTYDEESIERMYKHYRKQALSIHNN